MMHSLLEKKISVGEISYLISGVLICLGIQIIIINLFPHFAPLILIFFIMALFTIVLYSGYIKDLSTFLLIINFIPLLLLNKDFHYNFKLELLSFIPLFFLVIYSLIKYFILENTFSFRIGYLELPAVFLALYFGINVFFSISSGKNINFILTEYFHICLYLIILPVTYLLKERDKFIRVLKFLLLIAIIISIENIIFNRFLLSSRFATFQSGFLPVPIGVTFAYFLFDKKVTHRIGAIFLILILAIGIFVTLTRAIWVSALVVFLSVFIIYMKSNGKLTFFKTTLLIITLLIPFTLSGKMDVKSISKDKSVEYRTQSISNPTEDSSFLMRVELGYYAFKKFLNKPFFGNGLGDFVKYKIFSNGNNSPINYLDNSWLQMLWKGGIIGLFLFAWLYYRFFKSALFILRNTSDINVKIICLGLIGGFIGLSILAVLSPLLIKYKTNALIAFLFAYVEFERNIILSSEI